MAKVVKKLCAKKDSYFILEGWNSSFSNCLIIFLLPSVPDRFVLCSLWSVGLQFVFEEELLEDINKRHSQAGV